MSSKSSFPNMFSFHTIIRQYRRYTIQEVVINFRFGFGSYYIICPKYFTKTVHISMRKYTYSILQVSLEVWIVLTIVMRTSLALRDSWSCNFSHFRIIWYKNEGLAVFFPHILYIVIKCIQSTHFRDSHRDYDPRWRPRWKASITRRCRSKRSYICIQCRRSNTRRTSYLK